MNNNSISRRHALIKSALGLGSVQMRSLLTGLPIPLILGLSDSAIAASINKKFTVLSHLQSGDPVNVNAPGMYASNPNNTSDPKTTIYREKSDDFSKATEFKLGNTNVKAAKPWSTLPEDLRQRLGFWNHGTYTNAHSDLPNVLRFHGALKNKDGIGSTQLAEMIAEENASDLGTIIKEPLSVGGSPVSFGGRPIPILRPLDIKELFTGSFAGIEQMAKLRDKFIDRTYKSLKNNGTHAQKTFLDQYAVSRQDSLVIANDLGDLITDIEGDEGTDQAKMAVALFQTNIAPVVTLGFDFGGDNHGDDDLKVETTETTIAMESLKTLWTKLKGANLEDKTVLASLNVFGRTFFPNANKGRNHNGAHHMMYISSPNIKPGIVGGITPVEKEGKVVEFSATGINSTTGKSRNADIPFDETLISVGKTLAFASGISEERINVRFSGGKIIRGALK